MSSIKEKFKSLNIVIKNELLPKQREEEEYGHREYKRHFNLKKESIELTNKLINKRATQMQYRLYEGNGKTTYYIGVEDDGEVLGLDLNILVDSINYFQIVTKSIGAIINKVIIYSYILGDKRRYSCIIKVKKNLENINIDNF